MLALILKDLRSFSNNRKYLIIQFIVITILVFLFFIATVEFYAQAIDTNQNRTTFDVGKRLYKLFIICIYFTLFLIPKHAVESICMERSQMIYKDQGTGYYINTTILSFTPLTKWRILLGKWAAVVIWAFSGLCVTIPLFALSIYIGGLALMQLVECATVLLISCTFYALIGIVFASWLPSVHAKGISYGIILAFTFLPLLQVIPFASVPFLEVLSPFTALLKVLHTDTSQLWIWNTSLLCGLSLLIFLLLIRIYR